MTTADLTSRDVEASPASEPEDRRREAGPGQADLAPAEGPASHDWTYAHILDEMDRDRRNLRWALLAAVAFHLVLFFVHLPELTRPMEVTDAGKPKAYVVKQVRFSPPQAAPQRSIPEKKTRKIPIPDPTPTEPEPIREVEQLDLPDMDLDLPVGELELEVPEGPPGPPGEALGAVYVGGEVKAPEKIYAPRPGYTEDARQARVQGIVLLQAVIDREGNVVDLEVLKGLPMGLDQEALEAVSEWRFKPATRNGEPVPVYYNVTVSFTLQ